MKEPSLKLTLMHLGSVLLFCLALMLIIPPVPSDTKQTYHAFPAVFSAGAFLAGSLLIGRRAGPDPLWKIATQSALLIVYGCILFDRIQIH